MSTLAVLVVPPAAGTSIEDLEQVARSSMERNERVKAGGLVVGEIRYTGLASVSGTVAHRFTAEFPDA